MANSIAFDEQFYLTQNPDVAAAVSKGLFASGQEHYNEFGRYEQRDPNAYFDTSFYLGEYPDVAASGINPFQHFLQAGAAEGRTFNANEMSTIDTDGNGLATEFNGDAYLKANPDVADAVASGALKSAYQHFVLFGEFEGRTATLMDGTAVSGPFVNGGTGGGTPATGSTFTLTTGVDNITGTAGNDTVIGTISTSGLGISNSTLQSGDAINGGAGMDTLRVVSSTAGAAVTPSLSGVETIELNQFAASTVSLANSADVKNVTLANGDSNGSVTNISSLVTAGISNTASGTLNLTYAAAAVAGAMDVQNVTLNNAGTVATVANTSSLNIAGVEKMAITASGANFINTITDTALNTVSVMGDGDLRINTALAAGVTTFDGSASTGDLAVAFAAGGDVAATGGTGDDIFNFAGGLTTADTVVGGDGFDTVRATGADFTSATAAAPFNALSQVERVQFDGATATVNGSTFTNADVTNIDFNTTGADVINNAGSARTYEFGSADHTVPSVNGGAASFALSSGVTTVNIDLLGTTGVAPHTGTAVDVDNLTFTTAGAGATTTAITANITSMGDLTTPAAGAVYADASFNDLGLTTAAAGSTFHIDGSGNTALFGGNGAAVTAGFANNANIDTSALTGNTVIAGSDIAVQGTAGVGGAVSSTTTGVDNITVGSGHDTIVFHSGDASGTIEIAGATFAATGNILHDTVSGFQAGAAGDVLYVGANANAAVPDAGGLDYTAIQTTTQASINALSGAGATLQGAADLAINDAAANWTAFSFQGQTYAVFDVDNTSANFQNVDTLVQLTGVNVADLTDANFAM